MTIRRSLIVAAAAAALVALPALAQETPGRNGKVAGEVIEVRQSVATHNQGSLTEVRVRTQDRQEVWLRLGRPDEMGQRVQVGDRVRARLVAGNAGQSLDVRTLRNDTTGARLDLRAGDGTLLQQRDRDRDQTGARDRDQTRDRDRDQTGDRDQIRDRDRIHQPAGARGTGGARGSGGASGSGGRGGQGAGHQGGGRP